MYAYVSEYLNILLKRSPLTLLLSTSSCPPHNLITSFFNFAHHACVCAIIKSLDSPPICFSLPNLAP